MKKSLLVLPAIVGLVALPLARADVLPPGPGGGYPYLPPDHPSDPVNHYYGYVSPDQYHAMYDNVLRLDSVFHWGFLQSFAPPTFGTQIHTFGSSLELSGSVNNGVTWIPFSMSGVPNTTTVRITYNSPGNYSTEMTALNVSASTPFGPIMIRESPTLASTGQTTFTADPGGSGGYVIDSFFDIYTELSLDGGSSWIPDSSGPVHMQYVCPEPASMALVGLGVAGVLLTCRRNRRA